MARREACTGAVAHADRHAARLCGHFLDAPPEPDLDSRPLHFPCEDLPQRSALDHEIRVLELHPASRAVGQQLHHPGPVDHAGLDVAARDFAQLGRDDPRALGRAEVVAAVQHQCAQPLISQRSRSGQSGAGGSNDDDVIVGSVDPLAGVALQAGSHAGPRVRSSLAGSPSDRKR